MVNIVYRSKVKVTNSVVIKDLRFEDKDKELKPEDKDKDL